MSEDSDNDYGCIMPKIEKIETIGSHESLPQKSFLLYEKQYATFMEWFHKTEAKSLSEDVFMDYFTSKAENCKSSTLWSIYSMLKSTLAVKNNIDISKYTKLLEYLKVQNMGYKAKKSKVFSREEINKFLLDAPDESYLMWKVCLLIGIAGSCRRDEFRNLKLQDINDKDDLLLITISDTHSGKERTFTLTNTLFEGINPLALFRKYSALRPTHCTHHTFFINYRLGKCSTQVVGVHTFAKIPSLIAEYLHLPDPAEYTGHCYRRTSASLMSDSGADVLTLKIHGGWKSSTVPSEGIDEDSMTNKLNIARSILAGVSSEGLKSEPDFDNVCDPQPTSQTIYTPTVRTITNRNSEIISVSTSTLKSDIHIYNCTNCTIIINK